jgi:hypothetical protein
VQVISSEPTQKTRVDCVTVAVLRVAMLDRKAVLLVPERNILLLLLLLMALVVTVILFARPALEELILSAQPVLAQPILSSMEVSAEEPVQQGNTGNRWIIPVDGVNDCNSCIAGRYLSGTVPSSCIVGCNMTAC